MREATAKKAFIALQKHHFVASSFLQSNSCFDIAAKRGSEILLLKIFENIDSFREEQALELKKIMQAFGASAIIIGEKTKAFALKDNTAYERYGIPAISINSFTGILSKKLPLIHFFKGKETVTIDSEKMKEKRKQLGLSVSDLAKKIDSSPQAISRYEENSNATTEKAKRLENALQEKLVLGIDIFQKKAVGKKLFDEKISDSTFEKIQKLGLELALFDHAPFRAFGNPEESLLIEKGYGKPDLKKKAIELEKTKEIIKGHTVIISRETKYPRIGNTPIIAEEELDSFSKTKDLLETIKEREKKKR